MKLETRLMRQTDEERREEEVKSRRCDTINLFCTVSTKASARRLGRRYNTTGELAQHGWEGEKMT